MSSKQQYDFTIETLGPAKLSSPIRMSRRGGDGLADYVRDTDRILYSIETEQIGAQRGEYILLFFFRHIFHARAHNKGRPDVAVLNDRVEDLHPVQGADLDHVFVADILNSCGNADGIEVIGFETVAVRFVFQHDKQKLRVGFKFAAPVLEEILLKEIGDIGQKEYIVNWLDKHMHHPFHIMSVIGWCKIISTQTRRVLIHI